MKKLYILFIAMISMSTLFAQDRGKNNFQKNDYQQGNKQWGYNQQNDNYKDKGYSNDAHYYNARQQQMQEKNRRAEIDRVNRDYDQQIGRYRNDRFMNSYDRDRRIAEAQRERQQKISSFGKGIVTGAIVGLIAGAIFSH
jgi:outer membrane protein assembly factor BamD (BamD/ComL family)